jgi:uncharacterized protein YjbI with pentapeptide repeats
MNEPERGRTRREVVEIHPRPEADIAPKEPPSARPKPPPAGVDEPARLDKLLDAANAASGHVRNVYLTFLLFGLYLAIIFGATTHQQLLRAAPVTLPLLGIELPLLGFYWVAPALFVLLHLNLLLELYLLAGKLHRLDQAIGPPAGEPQETEAQRDRRAQLYPLPFSHMLIGRQHGRLMRVLLWLIVWLTVLVLPVVLLLFGQVRFLPYHDAATTMWHRVLVTLDALLLLTFWRPIRHPKDRLWTRPCRWLLHQGMALPGTVAALTLSWLILTFPGDEGSDWGDPMDELVLSIAPERLIESASLIRASAAGASELLRPTSYLFDRLSFLERNLVVREINLVESWPTQAQIEQYGEARAWQNFGVPPNLRNRDLRYAELSQSTLVHGDFRNANFQGALLLGADLRSASFHGAVLQSAVLHGANLRGTDLQEAVLRSAYLDCDSFSPCVDLQDADLRHAELQGAWLRGANLRDSNLQGANLSGADLTYANLQGADLSCDYFLDLDCTNLVDAELDHADLQDANLQGAKLQGASLGGADLQNAKLQGAKLQGAGLNEANLRGAELYQADLEGAVLVKADLQGAFLVDAILKNARLAGADIRGAMLYGADLRGANLAEANLMGAVLREASLQGAWLTCGLFGPPCANLQGADLRGADLWRTRVDEWGDPAHHWTLVDLRGVKANPMERAAKQWSDPPDVPQLRPGGHRSAPDVMFDGGDYLAEVLAWGARTWDTEDDYDEDLAEFLRELGCGANGSVYVAQGLARRALFDGENDNRLYAKRLAARLIDDCAPAVELPEDLRADLRRLAAQP